MNAAKQAAWMFFTLMVLACSGWYFASSSPVTKLDDQTLSKTADLVITNLTVSQFDATGQLSNHLHSPEMRHIAKNNTHLFKLPHIILSQKDEPAWEISAKQAKAIHNGEQITFIQKVIVHQNKGFNTQESTFKTEMLTYFSPKKLAMTDLPVRFEQQGTVIDAKGMKAYLVDKRVQLLSSAHATYEPTIKHG